MKKHNEAFLSLVAEAKKSIQELSVQDVAARLKANPKSFILVDVREDSEWSEGYITGAIHMGKGVIERDIESEIPEKSREIILYCGGGFRSALAAEALQKMGYQKVWSMDGGWRGWCEAQLPTTRP